MPASLSGQFQAQGRKALAGLQAWARDANAETPGSFRVVYHDDASGKEPRYYQRIAINKTIEAIAKGQDRLLLVMATGTGKTYTAFQIIRAFGFCLKFTSYLGTQ